MRIMMISENDLSSNESLGVTKKLKGQYKAFRNLGHEVYHLCLGEGNGVLLEGDSTRIVVPAKQKLYFTVASLYLSAPKLCEEHHIDMCYIRYPLADWAFMRMVKGLHRVCRVVVEIPTFPYEYQHRHSANLVEAINYRQDVVNRTSIHRFVDLTTNYNGYSSIYNVKSICLQNAVDTSVIRFVGDELNYHDEVNLIAVARIEDDHGYDRLLEGMRTYYSKARKQKIYFHIVGEGTAKKGLMDLAHGYSLDQFVRFYGVQTGADLENIYRKCNIAVGSLGTHRNRGVVTSALKNKEYCAIGIPIIGSTPDSSIPADAPYYRTVGNDDSPIELNDVIKYFEYIKCHPEMHRQMRLHAEQHMNWETQLTKVLHRCNTKIDA